VSLIIQRPGRKQEYADHTGQQQYQRLQPDTGQQQQGRSGSYHQCDLFSAATHGLRHAPYRLCYHRDRHQFQTMNDALRQP
jgi:hypothetical protein